MTSSVVGETGKQYLPGNNGKRLSESLQTFFCIFINYPKMHPTDHTSIGLLYPFYRRMTYGARYHLVVTLKVNLV